MKGFKPKIIIVLDKIESNVIIVFSQKLVHTQMMCVQLHRQVSKFAHVECLLHFCEAFACRLFHWIFVKLCTQASCYHIFQEYMDKKEGEESFFVGALRYLVFDIM
jgi:hypothetical protein